MTVGMIKACCQKCGIFPFDQNAIGTIRSKSIHIFRQKHIFSWCTDTFQVVSNASTSTSNPDCRVFQIALRDGESEILLEGIF